MRPWLLVGLALLLGTPSWSAGATINAASCAPADVQSAITTAVAGDTVHLPSCTYTNWGTQVTITKRIILEGNGLANTSLTRTTGGATIMFHLNGVTDFEMREMTVRGQSIPDVQDFNDTGLWIDNSTNFNIHHMAFARFARNIEIHGDPTVHGGVIHHSDFRENFVPSLGLGYGVVVYGNGTYPALALGTATNVFIEDNTFSLMKTAVEGNNGARFVFRYNAITNPRENAAAISAHGYDGGGWPRGTRQYEVYNNTIDLSVARYIGIGFTGGDGVVFNNQIDNIYTNPLFVNQPICTTYPQQDQIRALYFWNNTFLQGGAITSVANNCTALIQLDRDYFMTTLGGYTPYTYPHPLVGGTSAPPTVTITAPTSGTTQSTSTTPLTTLAGDATDDVGVTGVTWSCPTCTPTSGTATCGTCGAAATSVTWSVASLGLASGDNVLTVTAIDGDTQTAQDVLTVTYQQLAFPTAEGFGRFAQGGRGGKAYNINSLSNTWGSGGSCNAGGCAGGEITLRDCLQDRFGVGPRTCIFKVGGTLTWNCQADVGNPGCTVYTPYLTVAGQTAPGDGIMLKNFEFLFRNSHNIILRHLRIRPGKDIVLEETAGALDVDETVEHASHDLIFDHISFGWAPDDVTAIWGGHNITYQWTLMSEGMGGPSSGPSKCGQFNPFNSGTKAISLLHSFWSSHNDRCPALGMGDLQLVNNLFYDFYQGTHSHPSQPYPTVPFIEFVNNYWRPGPNSPTDGTNIVLYGCGSGPVCQNVTEAQVYLSGNIHTTLRPTLSGSESAMVVQTGSPVMPIVATPLGFPVIPSQVDAFAARDQALAKAGAYAVGDSTYAPPRRDSIDARAVTFFTLGTGPPASPMDEAAFGGYPTYASDTAYTDTDSDGIADAWETAHGLNPNDAADGPQLAANGYSNLENFLNELAGDPVVTSTGPSVTITAPTSSSTYGVTATPLTTLAGTASDDVDVSVAWTCPTCTPTGATTDCTGCGTPAATWSVASIGLALGPNVITVTATDGDSQIGTDQLTVTYTLQGAFLDDFNRPNEGPPPSSQWSSSVISTQPSLQVLGNALGIPTTVTSSAWWNASSFVADQSADIALADAVVSSLGHLRLYLRLAQPGVAGATDGYFCQFETDNTGAGNSYLRRLDNAAASGILATAAGVTWTSGDRARCSIQGSSLCAWRQPGGSGPWTQLVCLTDTTYTAGGFVGVGISHAELGLDDFDARSGPSASPAVTITVPTSSPTHGTSTTPVAVSGVATDDMGIPAGGITWTCPTCTPTSGVATCATCGPSATSVTWSMASVGLASGANVVTVTATDGDTQTAQDVLTVTYTPAGVTSSVAPAFQWALGAVGEPFVYLIIKLGVLVVTRIYTQSSGTPGITPTDWEFPNQINPVTVPGTLTLNTGSPMVSKAEATGITSPILRAMGRTILGPLAASTISGSAKGQMRGMENNAGANATLAVAMKLVQPNGTDRGVLLAPSAADSATAGNELVVNTLTNAQWKTAAESVTLALTTQAAQAGDYLVIEWGFRSATTTSRTITLSYGNDSASDLPENTTETLAQNPWWEFTADFSLLALPPIAVTAAAESLTPPPVTWAPQHRLVDLPSETAQAAPVAWSPQVRRVSVASVSALAQTVTSPVPIPNLALPFASTTSITFPGSMHGLGTAHLCLAVYDTAVPAVLIESGSVTVHPTSYDITLVFAQAQSGALIVNARAPTPGIAGNVLHAFTNQNSVTIPGTIHGLGTNNLLVHVYDAAIPALRLRPGRVTVHPTTYDVIVSFAQPQSGVVVLCGYAAPNGTLNMGFAFTAQTSVSIPGTTHELSTPRLLVEVYDAQMPGHRATSWAGERASDDLRCGRLVCPAAERPDCPQWLSTSPPTAPRHRWRECPCHPCGGRRAGAPRQPGHDDGLSPEHPP